MDGVEDFFAEEKEKKCTCNGKKVCKNCQKAEDDYYEEE